MKPGLKYFICVYPQHYGLLPPDCWCAPHNPESYNDPNGATPTMARYHSPPLLVLRKAEICPFGLCLRAPTTCRTVASWLLVPLGCVRHICLTRLLSRVSRLVHLQPQAGKYKFGARTPRTTNTPRRCCVLRKVEICTIGLCLRTPTTIRTVASWLLAPLGCVRLFA